MQALSCRQAAFNGAGSARRRQQLQQRGAGMVARADPGFCRDKISERTDRMDEIAGTSTVIFLGADNTEVAVEVPKGGYILDSGLDAGLELPFTCKGGICGCCVGRVAEGQVDQSDIADLSFVLTDEEVADGLTLMCMARPVSDVVRMETQSDWGYALGSNNWKGPSGHILGKAIDPLMGDRWGKSAAPPAAAEQP
ncbi:Ferredoxin-1 [Chlorella vulgaris]